MIDFLPLEHKHPSATSLFGHVSHQGRQGEEFLTGFAGLTGFFFYYIFRLWAYIGIFGRIWVVKKLSVPPDFVNRYKIFFF